MIYNEDCLVTMARMQEGSVDLVVTSPPYDGLRKYNGYSFDFEAVAKALFRVVKEGGVVVWVVGDQTKDGDESGTSFRQALHFKQIGFKLHDTMIYAKASQPRQSTRYEQAFEYMFVLSKGCSPITYNLIKRETANAGKFVKRTCRDGGKDALAFSESIVSQETILENIWFYGIKERGGKHPAIFPEALARDHILSWSNPGELVYDPFAGSGTTLKMAALNGRRFAGSEISAEYFEITVQRVIDTI